MLSSLQNNTQQQKQQRYKIYQLIILDKIQVMNKQFKTNIILLVAVSLASSFVVYVPTCTSDKSPNIAPFTYTVNGTVDLTTTAHMCHDEQFLYVEWFSIDEEIISTYTKCNDPLYNQDAVQFFISTNASYPNRYFEFEVSPSGQLFFADINNPNLNCSNLGTVYYPCTSATYSATINSRGWNGYLKIDLTIIGRGKKYDYYRGNLYRIDKSKSRPTRYLAYNPANNSPACFHQPLKFVEFQLV